MKVPSYAKYLFTVALLGICYYVTGKLGLKLATIHPSASSVWAPTGIALAAFLCLGYRCWPGIALGAFFVNITTAGSVLSSLGIALGNTLEPLLGAYLVNHLAGGRRAFETPQNVLKFLFLAGFVGTLVSPTVGVTSLALWGYAPWAEYGRIWFTWWLGDAAGALIVAPFLILWTEDWPFYRDRLRALEEILLVVTLLAVSRVVFDDLFIPGAARYPLEFLCIPPVIWAAYRFGPREASTATVVISAIALWGTLQGYGPFARASQTVSLLLLQTYMGVIAIIGLILATLVAERRRTEAVLRHANDSLELRVQERTLSLSRIVADLRAEADARKRIEKTLRESEDRFRLLVETVKDYAIYLLDADGKVASWNAGAERIKGYTEEEILGRPYSAFFTPDDIAVGKPEKELEKAHTDGRAEEMGYRLRKDGTRFWADVSITPLLDKTGALRGYANVTRDITERRRIEEALKTSETRFRQLMDSNIIGFMLLDNQDRVIDANEALLGMLGYARTELAYPGLEESTITPEAYRTIDQWAQERLAASGTCPPVEKEFIRKDGARVPVIVGMVQLHGSKGHRLCFVIDVTERRSAQDALRRAYDELELRVQQRTAELQEEIKRREHAEEELRNQAIRDPLTGLYNRRGFMMLGEKHLDLARRQQKPLLLFMGDLDDLKPINDMFGHAEGDRALGKVAEIMRATFRQSDVIARIGGDEFAVVGLEELDGTEAEQLIQRLQSALDDYNRYSGQSYRIHLSVGTARINPENEITLEQGMQQADGVLYEQKKHKSASPLKIHPV